MALVVALVVGTTVACEAGVKGPGPSAPPADAATHPLRFSWSINGLGAAQVCAPADLDEVLVTASTPEFQPQSLPCASGGGEQSVFAVSATSLNSLSGALKRSGTTVDMRTTPITVDPATGDFVAAFSFVVDVPDAGAP
jgi:hypothetical protein